LFERDIIINTHDIFEQFHKEVDETLKKIDEEVSSQSSAFRIKLKEKKSCNLRTSSYVVNQSEKNSKLKGGHRRKLTLDDDWNNPKIKTSFQHMILPSAVLKETAANLDKKQIKKGKKKILSINEVFDDYLSKFHFIYFQKVCENIVKIPIDTINDSYTKQISSYMKFQDQIEEILFMFKDDPQSDYLKSLDLMINDLQLKKEKNLMQITIDTNHTISKISEKHEIFELNKDTNFNDIIGNLVKSLYNILNN